MFKSISTINDVLPAVSSKKEIRFLQQPNGTVIACYLLMDSATFDSPEAIECRGIAFDSEGKVISRPLHKFFNIGEKESLTEDKILARNDVVGIYEKLDGSMIATALVDGELVLRSKKSYDSDVVLLANKFLEDPHNLRIKLFAEYMATNGFTAIFELTHPDAQIVINHKKPSLRLLHIRDNISGEYVMLDPDHWVQQHIEDFAVPLVKRFDGLSVKEALDNLKNMKDCEGYVIQFKNGEMVKAKSPWYKRLHKCLDMLRERDIARLALNEELDDVKGALTEIGISLEGIEKIESRLKQILCGVIDEVESLYESSKSLCKKAFAVSIAGHPLFGLVMQRYDGKEVQLKKWYEKTRLKNDFDLTLISNNHESVILEA